MNISIFELVLFAGLGIATLFVLVAVAFWRTLGAKARAFGYATTGEYLRAAPRTDEEKRAAVDLALKGLVVCLLGLLFPPFLLVGLFPLFYGARKLAYASMGLGLVDDADAPGA